MANVVLGSGPGLQLEYSASQVWGSGNRRTVKISIGVKVQYKSSSSRYGYPVNYYITVNGQTGPWRYVKGGEMWYGSDGYRWYSDELTVDVGTTSSKRIRVGVTFGSGSNAWNGRNQFWDFDVNKTNTKPVMSGSVSLNMSGTISEKAGSVSVTAPEGRDAEGNLAGYRIQASVNGGDYYTIYQGGGRTTSHSISSYGEGTTLRYRADCYDSDSEWSTDWAYSSTITKNKFTMATLASSEGINYTTPSISFSFSEGSNTQSGVGTSYKVSCSEITVKGNTSVSSPFTVTIYKGGSTPSGPYIEWNDIYSRFKSSGKGTLNFVLTGTNTNGTSRTSTKSISVNIQTQPNIVTGQAISTSSSLSTAYTSTKLGWFFIPDGSNKIRVSWNTVTGKLGEAIDYEVYSIIGDGDNWRYVARTSQNYYDDVVPTQTGSAKKLRYKIRAISKLNSALYTEGVTSHQMLYHYGGIILESKVTSRTASTATISVTVKSTTSIPGVQTVGSWSATNGAKGSLSGSQGAQTISLSGLSDSASYTVSVTYNDNTGLTKDSRTTPISVTANQSIFFVNKYGVGIGGKKADSSIALSVKGGLALDGRLKSSLKKDAVSTSWISGAKGDGCIIDMPNKNGYNPIVRQKTTNGAWTIGTYNEDALLFSYMSDTNMNAGTNALNGQIKLPINITGTVYTTGNKPRPEDIGAARVDHTHPELGNTLANGGTINGILRVNDTIQAYAYGKSNNKAAITIDKPGTGCFGIGANGNAMQIQYGQVNDLNGGWSGSQGLTHIFKGNVEAIGGNVVTRGGYFYTDTGTIWFGNDDKIWYNDSSNYFNFYADDSLWSSGIDVGNVMFKTLRNKGSNMDVDLSNGVSMWFNTGSATNSHWFINRAFSGGSGTECSFYPSRGGGYGWVGSSGYPVFRVYSYNFNTASKRSNKYNISKAPSEDLYNYVKDLEVYTYRHDSSSEDPDTQEFSVNKRKDLQIGCMVDELPTEVVDYDTEGGEGNGVDLYAYSSMILGATKELIKKVEALEIENSRLIERIEILEGEK